MPVTAVRKKAVSRLTVDLGSGTHDRFFSKLEALRFAQNGAALPADTFATTFIRGMVGSWVRGEINGPQPCIRLTTDLSLGTYRRLDERLDQLNANLPNRALHVTKQGLVRYFIGSLLGDHH